tara:strand:+ start:69 stop:305 length:237 start_codon:yes stop_codon:yes gene_type:complete
MRPDFQLQAVQNMGPPSLAKTPKGFVSGLNIPRNHGLWYSEYTSLPQLGHFPINVVSLHPKQVRETSLAIAVLGIPLS